MATTTATNDPAPQPSQSPASPTPPLPASPPNPFVVTWQVICALFFTVFTYIGEIAILTVQTVRTVLSRGLWVSDLFSQMYAIGIGTLPIALLTVFSSSAVIALYFAQFLIRYGAGNLTGAVVALALGRELSPVLVGVVTAARSGSAMAAEIGTMEVSEQIAALRSLAVSPIKYLVAPRVLACLIMVPILGIVADAFGLFGGYVVAVWQGVQPSTYPESIHQFVEMRDFTMGIIKTVVFALIVGIVSCHQGLKTNGGATGVGRATTNAVVLSIVLIYIFDFVLADIMFGGRPV